ncbi:MAG: tRNA (guanosine(46)-N7)-methyltransferase TrmB [Planctomycetota bacterium]
MGRRALPKLDPTVDFSQHIGEVDDLTAPFCPQSLFPQTADLEIEVGSGKGLFVLNESGRVPERNFLGNEVARKYCRFAAYRLAKHERQNARMLCGDGLKLFRELLPDRCAMAVHVYFPDPWWKERHRRRRVMQPSFIADLERVLIPGGVFHFWTDVEEYFEETIGLMKEHSGLSDPQHVSERPAEHDMDYRTHFERRMRKHDHDVFRSQFLKPA